MIVIHKFGGGCLNSAKAIRRVPKILQRDEFAGTTKVVVVSAFSKTTNLICDLTQAHIVGDVALRKKAFGEFCDFHEGIAKELFSDPAEEVSMSLVTAFAYLDCPTCVLGGSILSKEYCLDQMMPVGEILASKIVSKYLSAQGLPNNLISAKDFIQTDYMFGRAGVRKGRTSALLHKILLPFDFPKPNQIYLTQGFIGAYQEGVFTTLGREGSDYTAGILGNLLGAKEVILWKDVLGVMSENPKSTGVNPPELYDKLSYKECLGLLGGPAKGLVHPKTLQEVYEKKIPLRVRSFLDLECPGTLIC